MSRPPSWARQMLLLWGLRRRLARGGAERGLGGLLSKGGLFVLLGTGLLFARLTFALLTSEPVVEDNHLTLFLLLLLGFLASTLQILWPVVTATVDDAAEISRFNAFPIRPRQLFFASLLASLVEARTFPIWGALFGAAAAMVTRGTSALIAFPATLALGFASGAWGRAMLHVLLDLLRSRRSAEAMGGGLLILLFLTALVPPPDLSWFKTLRLGAEGVDSQLMAGATVVFTILPTGAWGWALFMGTIDVPVGAILAIAGLLVTGGIGAGVAWVFLARFHRHAARALPHFQPGRRTRRAFASPSLFLVLAERELRDVLLNPRVRVMAALPFFLTILLKLVGARALAETLWATRADAWLMGAVAAYGTVVLGGGLAQNAFGYDGHGAAALFAAPVAPSLLLRAKNLVHGGAAMLLSIALIAFYALLIEVPSAWITLAVLGSALWQAAWFVAVGNLLSVLFPVRFNASLKRRDRAPPPSVAVGLVATGFSLLPLTLVLRSGMFATSPVAALAFVWLFVPLGFAFRAASERRALQLLQNRRADVLRAVGHG